MRVLLAMDRQLSQAGGHRRQGAEDESSNRPAHSNKSRRWKTLPAMQSHLLSRCGPQPPGLPLRRGHRRRQLITEAPHGLPAMARHRKRPAKASATASPKRGAARP